MLQDGHSVSAYLLNKSLELGGYTRSFYRQFVSPCSQTNDDMYKNYSFSQIMKENGLFNPNGLDIQLNTFDFDTFFLDNMPGIR